MTMKNKYFAFMALATTVLATACAGDETTAEQKQNTDGTKTVTLTASVKEGQTRVGMTKNSDGTSASFYWHGTDKILVQTVNDGTYSGAEFSTTAKDEATSADFTGKVTGTVGTYAVYPYSANHSFTGEKSLTYNLPSSYDN